MASRWEQGRFAATDEDPLGPLANLLDLMLVFACGLIAALISMSEQLQQHFQPSQSDRLQSVQEQVVEQGRELPQIPGQGASGGEGYESVGKVYRDPKTGKLILIGE